MKREFEINGEAVSFTECTAIFYNIPGAIGIERESEPAIFVQYKESNQMDGVMIAPVLPESAKETSDMLVDEYMDTGNKTISSVCYYVEPAPSGDKLNSREI